MASTMSIALRRATAPSLFFKLFNPVRSASVAAPSASRSFNTNTQVTNYDEGGSVDVQRRSDRSMSRLGDLAPSFFSEAFDPFSPTRSLRQVLNWIDQLMDAPFVGSGSGGGGFRRGWDVKEDESALHLRMDMPGLSKEDVKVLVEHNTLIIRGEASDDEQQEDESGRRRYSTRLDLPPNIYQLDSIKATVNNGVLKLIIPKVTHEEKQKHVHQVLIE